MKQFFDYQLGNIWAVDTLDSRIGSPMWLICYVISYDIRACSYDAPVDVDVDGLCPVVEIETVTQA